MSAPRPLLNLQPVDEFGALTAADFENNGDPDLGARYTYVPGFSDLRHQRDVELGEVARGARLAKDVIALPVNVRISRRSSVKDGTPDALKLTSALNQGYRPMTEKDVGQKWLTAIPPGATIQPDGTIRNAAGDGQYMVCDAQTARRNKARKERATQAMLDNAATQAQGLVAMGATIKGSNPTVTKEKV